MWPRRFPWPLRWWATIYLVPRTPQWLAPAPSIHPPGGLPGGPPGALVRSFLPRNSSPLLRDPVRSSAVPPKTTCAALPAALPARASPLPRTPWRGTTPRSTASPIPATPSALPERRHHRDLQHPRRYRARYGFRALLRLVDQQVLEPRHPAPLPRRVRYQVRKLPLVLPPLRSLIAPENRRFQRRFSPNGPLSELVGSDNLREYQRHHNGNRSSLACCRRHCCQTCTQ